jgi:ankyrin repeat protein
VLLTSIAGVVAAGPDAPLADAAEKMDRAAIRTLLRRHANVNAPQVDGMTALHWATYQDDVETVELLIRAGASAKAANRYGVTPLSLAAANGNAAIVESLLKAGADPNAALPGGETPLMTAARRIARSVKALSSAAPMSTPKTIGAQTALMGGGEGHADVETLITAGAISPALDLRSRPVVCGRATQRCVREAGRRRGRERHRADGRSAAMAVGCRRRGAAPGGDERALQLAADLLDAGANPNGDLTDTLCCTRLRSFANQASATTIRPEGSEPGSIELVKKLAAAGADLNARMIRRANLANTRFNELGATPFMLAALTADAELLKTLAALGADTKLGNADNTTPLMVAAGLATRSPGEDAGTEPEVLEALQVLLDLGADINAVDNNGETAMHAAAYKNLPEVVKFLASKGAKIELWNKDNKFGWTPLAIAVGYRFGNFKPSAETEAAVRAVMIAAGVTPPKTVTAKTQQIYQ